MRIVNYRNSIYEIKNACDDDFCEKIINLWKHKSYRVVRQKIGFYQNRDCYALLHNNKRLDDNIHNVFFNILDKFIKHLTNESIGSSDFLGLSFSPFEILKYDKKTIGIRHHTDSICHLRNFRRYFTIALYLNSCGGYMNFTSQKIKIEMRKKSALIFPSTFFYPHYSAGPYSTDKYNIVTWAGHYGNFNY